jgi:outer membrane protein
VKSRYIVAPLLALACSLSAFAQAQKMAVINMQDALLGTKDGQKAAADLKSKFTPKEQDLQKKQQDIQAKTEQLRKTGNTISDDAKASLQRDIDTLQRNLQRDSQDAQQDLQAEQQRVLGDLSQKMQQVVNKYAIDKNITMVFDVSGQPNNVIFASSSTDITRDIVTLYDAALPTTPATPLVKPPAASTTTTTPPAAAPKKPATAAPGATPPHE